MTWHTFSGDSPSEADQAAIRQHLRTRLLGIDLRYFGQGHAGNTVVPTIYDPQFSAPPNAIAIAAAAKQAIADAFRILVVEIGELPAPGFVRPGAPNPIARIEIVLHGLEPGQAEAALSMPDPRPFQDALATGESMQSLADRTVAAMTQLLDNELETELSRL